MFDSDINDPKGFVIEQWISLLGSCIELSRVSKRDDSSGHYRE